LTYFLSFVFLSQIEAKSGPRASQGRSTNKGAAAPKRNGNGSNNNTQKAQGHGPQPNGSSKQQRQAPKPPKLSQPFFGGHSPAPKSALTRPSSAPPRPPHPGNVQHVHVPRAHGTSIAGNKVFQDPSLTSKQSHRHVQKTQNHVPTPPNTFESRTRQPQSGKNTTANNTTANNTSPKVQVAEKHAQQSSHGSQSSATSKSAKGPRRNSSPQQQLRGKPPGFSLDRIIPASGGWWH